MGSFRTKSGKVALLKKVPLFEGLSDRQLQQIARLADELEVPQGHRLATAGEAGRELFILVDGAAVVRTPQGRAIALAGGDFFGEMSLIDGAPRSADVYTQTASKMLVVGQREFWELLQTVPLLARGIMKTLTGRLREADKAYSACP